MQINYQRNQAVIPVMLNSLLLQSSLNNYQWTRFYTISCIKIAMTRSTKTLNFTRIKIGRQLQT